MHRYIREGKDLSGLFPSMTMLKRRTPPRLSTLSFLALLCPVLALAASGSPPSSNVLLPPDASALLAFKSKADLNGVLRFSPDTGFFFCQWQGVQCVRGRAVHLVLEGLKLGGVISPGSLTRLDQLRVLSLQNDSLAGQIPDLSGLVNLKTLFLGHNAFTGSFPQSILSLHRVRTLDLSYNGLTGPLPSWLAELDRLYFLRLDGNRFNGTIPPLNQSSLQTFNVSGNNLTGAIPVTPVLARFELSSYSWNPGLCGEIINKECKPGPPFFGTSSTAASVKPPPPAMAMGQSVEVQGFNKTQPPQKKYKRTAVILGFSSGVAVLVCSLLCFAVALKKQRESSRLAASPIMASDAAAAAQAAAVMQIEQENELEEKVKRVQGMQVTAKSGSLLFCAGEAQLYSLEQLMRASAELLGRGTTGTTYKAVLDSGLIVSVKRMDGGKMEGTTKEAFERHMESVGGLRHPNLVPLRAYFQAKEERLLIYDYQPNGSLFSLIHGSKSARAKPLHWTSCLKIAEDVAQGLSYIHQAWRLVHGNLTSSNVLLGPDFEACLVDYCLSVLITPTPLDVDDPDLAAYRAPESRDPRHAPTNKSDVYAYGTLLLELLTGRPPSQHPRPMPGDVMGWVRSTREDDGSGGDDRLAMLLEIAVACGAKSPEHRPTMWQVLKMLQEIKESVLDDSELDLHKQQSPAS